MTNSCISLLVPFFLILIASPANLLATTDITIDYSRSRLEKLNSSYYIGQLFFANLISPYKINYNNLPTDWVTSEYYLYIPTYVQKSAPSSKELFVSVSDKLGRFRQFRFYVIIQVNKIYFSPTLSSQMQQPNTTSTFQSSFQTYTLTNNSQPTAAANTSKNSSTPSTLNNNSLITRTQNNTQTLTNQQLINSIDRNPQFQKIPIQNIQPLNAYRIQSTPTSPPNQKIQTNESITIEERIKLILKAVEEEYNSVPKVIDSETGLVTVKPIDSIFSEVPKIPQLKQLLQLPNPGIYLSKSIQQVVSSQLLNCQQKISYLLETYGITQAHIEIIESQYNEVFIRNDFAYEAINKLKSELQSVNDQIEIEKQKDILTQEDLNKGLEELSHLYRLYNEQVLKSQLSIQAPYNPLFAKSQEAKLKNDVKIEEQKLQTLKFVYEESQNELKKIELEYQIKKNKTEYYKNQLSIQEERLADFKDRLMKVQQQNNLQQVGSREYLDQLKLAYLKKEVEVSRYRSNIQSSTLKQTTIKKNMRRIQQEINQNQENLDQKKQRDLSFTLLNLKISLPNIQTEVDRIYYRCYRAGNIMIKQNGTRNDSFIYVMKIPEWTDYMNNVYGVSQSWLLNYLNQRGDQFLKAGSEEIAIYPHNIFSTVWTKSLGTIQLDDMQRIFQLDFTCLKPSTLETSSGILKFIWKNILIVQDLTNKNKLYELKLGTCSRIEVVNKIIPENGMLVFWRGNLGQKGYNVYLATMI